MLVNPPQTPQSEIDTWLAALGFSPGRHPFQYTNADDERDLIPRSFVDVEGYEQIKGSKTIIVFAPKGGGKSALRLVLANQAAPLSPEKEILAVECTDFDLLLQKQHEAQPLTIIEYLYWLLRAGLKSLFDALFPVQRSTFTEIAVTKDIQSKRAESLLPPARFRLARCLRQYHPTLLGAETLYERFNWLDPAFKPDWEKFIDYFHRKELHELLQTTPLHTNVSARLLASLNDYMIAADDSKVTPKEQMQEFVNLVQAAGFTAVHFLVDRLDETSTTASKPQMQADILEPLLAHLVLLETPGTAFKFFLSKEARDVLLERPTIRRDRLTDQALTITWSRERLKALLDARLNTYSDGEVQELLQLCREIKVKDSNSQDFWLGEWIEMEMLQQAQGSPRLLLKAGQFLFQAHLDQFGPRGLLEKEDWDVGKKALVKNSPPLLKISRHSSIVIVGNREVKLSSQEHQFLLILATANGLCDRDILAKKIWGSDINDDPIYKIVNRIRNKLRDNAKDPSYLITERGKGFRLIHYELI